MLQLQPLHTTQEPLPKVKPKDTSTTGSEPHPRRTCPTRHHLRSHPSEAWRPPPGRPLPPHPLLSSSFSDFSLSFHFLTFLSVLYSAGSSPQDSVPCPPESICTISRLHWLGVLAGLESLSVCVRQLRVCLAAPRPVFWGRLGRPSVWGPAPPSLVWKLHTPEPPQACHCR